MSGRWDWDVLLRPFDRLAETQHHLRGAVAFRYIVGVALLYQLGVLAGSHRYFFGADALIPFEEFAAGFGSDHVSFLALSAHPLWSFIGYGLGLGILLMWTLGYGRHLGTALAWWALHSLHRRSPGIWDGGDNLIEIVLLYAIPLELWGRAACSNRKVANALHNLGLAACVVQVCIMYFNAGLAKVPGKYWQNGTAFYYVLASEEFGLTRLGPLLWDSRVLLGLLTWAPLLLQLAFPWIYLFGRPWPRRIVVVSAIGFHIGILTLMGLSTFAVIMIGAEMLLLSDQDWQALADSLRRAGEFIRRKRQPTPNPEGSES